MAVQYARHFSNRIPTWDQAQRWHGFLGHYVNGTGRGVPNRVLGTAGLSDMWDGLTGQADPANSPLLADCISMTMPSEYAGLFVVSDSVAAVYALVCLDQELAGVPLNDSYAIRKALPAGWAKFRKRRQAAGLIHYGTGCDHSASWQILTDIETITDPEMVAAIEEICSLAGHMFDEIAPAKTRSPNDNPESVTGATIGGDFSRLTSSEQAKICTPATAIATTMKLVRGQTMEKKMAGTETNGRGPLVILKDESGSMRSGKRHIWATAVAVVMVRIAWQENRAAKAVHFASSTVVQELPQNDARAMFEMMRSFMNGGTNTASAIDRGIEQVGDLAAAGHSGADIMLITDGVDDDDRGMAAKIDKMDASGTRLWSVGVGDDFPVDHVLRTRAERYVYASDGQMANRDTATLLAGQLSDAALDNSGDPTLN